MDSGRYALSAPHFGQVCVRLVHADRLSPGSAPGSPTFGLSPDQLGYGLTQQVHLFAVCMTRSANKYQRGKEVSLPDEISPEKQNLIRTMVQAGLTLGFKGPTPQWAVELMEARGKVAYATRERPSKRGSIPQDQGRCRLSGL